MAINWTEIGITHAGNAADSSWKGNLWLEWLFENETLMDWKENNHAR